MSPEKFELTKGFDDEDMITFGDVDNAERKNTYMLYDAFILYTDDPLDVAFAFEIKKTMEEKFNFKVNA